MRKSFYKGFTIIEFLLAFLIIGIALIGGSAFYFASSKTLVKADITRLATWKAIEKIEKLKATDYSLIQNETENITIGNVQAQRITTVSENPSPQWKEITVEVRWQRNSISLSTIIARP
ncbi:MAG: prepilin-type N-terminal cleavage/methylation domain-containing protein [Candidatus Omnitrophica bacterium]|nr:prepilin-type N-terminal cleavage/methylation domain-containing protein [Candidatus Omnitrophota bacterium]MCM8817600.1 prepilin-type N-terminal cleavage/methylation domain-containing protein [Candidatus Omnitrophota bacterium]